MKKPETYYINARIEMLQFVPRTAKKILDIGCGEGVFGSILKNELQAEVWGIEMDVVSGTKAGQVLDKVIISDVFSSLPKITCETFDAIISASKLRIRPILMTSAATILGSIAAACECAFDGNRPVTPNDVRKRIDNIESAIKFEQ